MEKSIIAAMDLMNATVTDFYTLMSNTTLSSYIGLKNISVQTHVEVDRYPHIFSVIGGDVFLSLIVAWLDGLAALINRKTVSEVVNNKLCYQFV